MSWNNARTVPEAFLPWDACRMSFHFVRVVMLEASPVPLVDRYWRCAHIC